MSDSDAWLDPASPMQGIAGTWRRWALTQDCISANFASPATIAMRQKRRLDALIAHARRRSAFYRRLYQDLPDRPLLTQLPSVGKRALMAEFDDTLTHPSLNEEAIRRFIADPNRIGESYPGGYAVWTSSGSTGEPGIFVQDTTALAVYDTLLLTRIAGENNGMALWQSAMSGGRMAMIAAVDGHYAGVVTWERMRHEHALLRDRCRVFSLMQPFEKLITQLEDFAPSFVASYPTTMLLLAEQKRAGRLKIEPVSIGCGGETMSSIERRQIADAFGCSVFEDYGASECMAIAFDCGQGALHVNADWVILEPVDEKGLPVPDGEPSCSVLLTNLANRIQPLIRYELGDSITVLPGRCGCGCPLPAIHVDGRRDDILAFADRNNRLRRFAPLAIESAVEESTGLSRFQVVQTSRKQIAVRFDPVAGETAVATFERIRQALKAFLLAQGVDSVRFNHDPSRPKSHPVSGKFRQVISEMNDKIET